MFKEVEKMTSKASWYQGGYRAQSVTYTISYLSYMISKKKKFLNFNLIWEAQKLSQELLEILESIAEKIYYEITNPPEGNANASQWCKKDLCWTTIKELDFQIDIDEDLLLDSEEAKYNKREEKQEKRLVKDLEMQTFVLKTDLDSWKKLYNYYKKDEFELRISPMQLDILSKYSIGHISLPSAKQSKVLYGLYYNALDEGLVFD